VLCSSDTGFLDSLPLYRGELVNSLYGQTHSWLNNPGGFELVIASALYIFEYLLISFILLYCTLRCGYCIGLSRYIATATLAIIAVFLEYLRHFLIDIHQIYRHSSVLQNTSPCIFSAS